MRKVWVQFSGCLPIKFLLPFFVLVSLAACNFPLGSPTSFFDPTSFAQTAEFQLTQIAANVATMVGANLTQPAVTPTPIVITLTPSPILSFTPAPPEASCDRAGAGAILDVTYPDDSRLLPGQPFTKIWRLVNRGSCPWNRDYQVVWFSGDRLGTSSSQPLPARLTPVRAWILQWTCWLPNNPVYIPVTGCCEIRKGNCLGLGRAEMLRFGCGFKSLRCIPRHQLQLRP